MDKFVHRPCCSWFAHQRVRLTKPPQIATWWVEASPCRGILRSCARAPTCGDWCRFRAAGLGPGARPTCGAHRGCTSRKRSRRLRLAGRMNVFSARRGKIFNLCGTPQNMTSRHIISDLRFLRNSHVGCAANGPRHHRKRQEFQLMAPQVEILASLRGKNRHAGARGTNEGARLAAPCRPCGPLVRAKGVCPRRASRTFGGGAHGRLRRRLRLWAATGEKQRSRADGRVCPSALPPMVRPPAGSPYETSTNRQTCGLAPRRGRRWRAACSRVITRCDWCRFRAASLGSGAPPTCGRPAESRA